MVEAVKKSNTQNQNLQPKKKKRKTKVSYLQSCQKHLNSEDIESVLIK